MQPFTHFVFVDFENVQDIDLALVQDKPVRVTFLIGAKQTKVSFELTKQILAFAPQIALVEVGGSGRNALDLTLAMFLGREIERHPQANFIIVSRDQDFDPMIAHLKVAGAQVERVSSFAAIPAFASARKSVRPARPSRTPAPKPQARPSPPSAPKAAVPPVTSVAKATDTPLPPRIGVDVIPDLERRQKAIFSRLSDPANKNRPATQKALAAHLRTALGKDAADADVAATTAQLMDRRVLSIDAQKRVVYAQH